MDYEYVLPSKDLLLKTEELFDKNSKQFSLSKMIFKKDLSKKLTVPLGIDEHGEKYYIDLSNISSLLISGTTGSGKSVLLDSMIISLLLKNSPREINFIFFDPKKVELGEYDGLPHILNDINGDKDKLNQVMYLLEYRKYLLKENHVKTIEEYNNKNKDKLSKVFVIIDESINLMDYDQIDKILKNIMNEGISLGIHIILATNSYLKKDFDSRLISSFPYILSYEQADSSNSKHLNIKGAELLTTEGEALVKCRNNDLIKLQTPFVSDEEIKKVVEYIKNNK